MTITTRLYTYLFGSHVGMDAFGNRYYRRSGRTHGTSSISDNRKHEKRWVLYKAQPIAMGEWVLIFSLIGLPIFLIIHRWDVAEPSKVPPEWHGWLHYTTDTPPTQHSTIHHAWEKPPLPNLTGTQGAYLPPGHLAKAARPAPTTTEYVAWKPQ